MLQFLKALKLLALLSTFRMLSLEQQNECTFILLPEHDWPDLSAVAAQSTQSNSVRASLKPVRSATWSQPFTLSRR